MKFIKDILLFQIETTGQNIDRDSIIQLSAILLDKDNLLEKNSFNSYVKVSFIDSTITQHAEMLNVPFETLQKSPKLYEVIKSFAATFGSTPLLASHSVANVQFLRQAFKKTFIPYEYDAHVLDLWSLGYVYTLHYGLKKMPTMQTLFHHFNLKQKNPHDALEKARLSSEVFRKIVIG
jgi:DNA polymerase III epsilon subunit-like protein